MARNGVKKADQHKKVFWLLVVLAVIYLPFLKSKNSIVNYPSWLCYSLFAFITALLLILRRKNLWSQLLTVKDFPSGSALTVRILTVLIFSWFVAGTILTPFNYYDIYIARQNYVEYVDCKITKVSTYSRDRKLFYEFRNQTNVLYTYKPIMEEIRKNEQYEAYVLSAKVRSGLLGSYLLEDWEIKKK